MCVFESDEHVSLLVDVYFYLQPCKKQAYKRKIASDSTGVKTKQ